MRALSNDFGGYVDLGAGSGARPTVPAAAILDQLRVRYVIGYDSYADAGADDTRIRVARPGATVQIRKVRRHR